MAASDKNPRLSIGAQSDDSQHLTQSEVDRKPWKYIGYKGYSSFMASENDFFVLRRFSKITIRIALRLQDQVTVLEDRLRQIDKQNSKRDAADVHNGSFRDDIEERSHVLDELEVALIKFKTLVLQEAELQKHPRPSPYDIRSLQNWHHNHLQEAISPPEYEYLSHTRDLFSVIPKEKPPLRRLLERAESFRVHWIFKEKEAPSLPLYDRHLVTYISDKRVDTFAYVVIVGVGMAMLIAPMWVLEFLDSQLVKLATITTFIIAFLAMISGASSAKPFEVLAATAAYSAVLMVFLQLGANTTSTGETMT